LTANLGKLAGEKQKPANQKRCSENERQRRKYPTDTPEVEVQEAKFLGSAFTDDTRDQKPRYHKENINTDESPFQHVRKSVKKDYRKHRGRT
jgi:hypothetical protein